jgi:hypothetical protein
VSRGLCANHRQAARFRHAEAAMLAPTLDGNRQGAVSIGRVRARSVALDTALLFTACGIAGVFLFQGGAEALIGAGLGALIGLRAAHWRNAQLASAISGAFAGLFAGALFAGFFHGALAAVFNAF